MARKKPTPKHEILVRSLAHTTDTEAITRSLSQDATDTIGRAVSNSAVIRALLHYADTQGTNWTQQTIFPLIENELQSGMIWGKRK